MLSFSNFPSIRVGLRVLKLLIRSDVYQFLHVLVTNVYQVLHAVQQEVKKKELLVIVLLRRTNASVPLLAGFYSHPCLYLCYAVPTDYLVAAVM